MEERDEIRYQQAKKRVKQLKGFYVHLLVYVLVNAIIIFWVKIGSFTLK